MNIHVTRGAEGLDRRAFSVDEVQRMLETGILDWEDRFELIEGEIVPMNSQSTPHFLIKSRLGGWFAGNLDRTLDVGIDGTVEMGPNGLFEPDVVVLKRQKLVPRTFVKIADALLVIEIADAGFARDMGVKAQIYAAADVPELWVLDLNRRVTHVHREPSANGYNSIIMTSFDDMLVPAKVITPPVRVADFED